MTNVTWSQRGQQFFLSKERRETVKSYGFDGGRASRPSGDLIDDQRGGGCINLMRCLVYAQSRITERKVEVFDTVHTVLPLPDGRANFDGACFVGGPGLVSVRLTFGPLRPLEVPHSLLARFQGEYRVWMLFVFRKRAKDSRSIQWKRGNMISRTDFRLEARHGVFWAEGAHAG